MGAPPPMPTRRHPKRLLFDRRYGWVFDEWKDPSEEALAGGRGMFCILPITKCFLNLASQLMNGAATSTVRALESPSQFSPQALRANLMTQCHRFMRFMQKPNLRLLHFYRDSSRDAV